MEELDSHTAFTIPIFGGIPVAESVVVTWGIMAFLVILSILFTRHLKKGAWQGSACGGDLCGIYQ